MSQLLDLAHHVVVLADPSPPAGGGVLPNIAPDKNAPGAGAFTSLIGALMYYGLLAGIAGLLLGAISFGLGKYFGNHHATTAGRTGMLGSLAATIVVGGGASLVNWAFNLGATIS
ncbi:DUF6112 family protein [Kitasatospora sp. NPDC058048]|uniref:DUF6112 family protein n=1 Tax=Kitasatospora sp. NPDC058048 TaxID=3346313 RepID=UPI0036DE4456